MAKKKKIKNVIINKDGSFELVDKFGDEDLFDDCPVCQAVKQAQEKGRELTLNGLKEASQKAKEQGAVVGGEWLEKPEGPEKKN